MLTIHSNSGSAMQTGESNVVICGRLLDLPVLTILLASYHRQFIEQGLQTNHCTSAAESKSKSKPVIQHDTLS